MDKRTFYYWLYTFLLVAITIIAGVWLNTSTMYTATITNSADSVSEPVSVADAKSIATQGNGNTQNIQFNSEAADRVGGRCALHYAGKCPFLGCARSTGSSSTSILLR